MRVYSESLVKELRIFKLVIKGVSLEMWEIKGYLIDLGFGGEGGVT